MDSQPPPPLSAAIVPIIDVDDREVLDNSAAVALHEQLLAKARLQANHAVSKPSPSEPPPPPLSTPMLGSDED